MFGGYLPVEMHNRKFFLKTLRRLNAQREENAHTKYTAKGINRYLTKTEMRGQVCLQEKPCPLH
jgi:hypothetical protein